MSLNLVFSHVFLFKFVKANLIFFFPGGIPRNLQVIERAGEDVMKKTTLFRKVGF